MMTSMRLGGAVVSAISPNVRDRGSIPALDAIFPMFTIPLTHDTVCQDLCHVQIVTCTVVEPTLCVYISKWITRMYTYMYAM